MAQAGWIISLATKTRLFKNRTNFTSLPQHCLFKQVQEVSIQRIYYKYPHFRHSLCRHVN